jgi:cell division protein FtsL
MPKQGRGARRRPAVRGLPRKDQLALTVLVLLNFCCCVIVAFYFAQVLLTGYRINIAERELTRLRIESNDLYGQVNQLTSLENVEAIAVHKLGMVKPQNDRIVVVQEASPVEKQTVAANDGNTGRAGSNAQAISVQKQRGPNWLIRTFADMVSMWEASIQAG